MNRSISSQPLHLYNTLTRQRQPFVPRIPGRIKIFTCGPSIYANPHIGNYRTFLYEDILCRYLEYLGYRVERLINFTDIEDKTIAKAGKSMRTLREMTERAAENFFTTSGLLHLKVPDYIPRSSTSVDQTVLLIEKLLAKGLCYRHGPDIFYDPLKFPGFGKLYGLDMASWPRQKRRFRKDNYPGNRWNRGDFILWHGYRPERDGDIYWKTGLGKGRPAWNVQDPAMITKTLGHEIDISCGGVDNLFRHHDYTIAVIEGVSGRPFASYWLHGEHVLRDGKKISKSRGNAVGIESLLARGISAAGLRYFLMRGHYRRKLDLTDDRLRAADDQCRHLRELARGFTEPPQGKGPDRQAGEILIDQVERDFTSAMNNDLQVDAAVDALYTGLEAMARYQRATGFGTRQWGRIRKLLLRIESVLQILFV